MKPHRLLPCLFLLPPLAWADLDCLDSEYLVSGTFGVNPTATDLPPIIGLPGAESADLLQVQIQWLAMADRERQNEVITVDYQAQTTTNVDVFDGETASIASTDLRQAEIDASSNFSRGQLNVNWCMPVGRTDGLIFAIYESGGDLVGLQGSPFAVFDNTTSTAVLNQAITNQMGFEFNTGGAEATQEDIEAVTGMYPPRYLAEHIFQRDIPAMLTDELKNQAPMQNPTNGVIVGNMFIVTGPDASADTPTSVDRAYRGDMDYLTSLKSLHALDTRQGEWSFQVGGERRPVFVVEGRVDLTSDATECKDNTSNITASFDHSSPLHSVIELWESGNSASSIERVENGELDVVASCDSDHIVYARRYIRGHQIGESTHYHKLAVTTQELAIDMVRTYFPPIDARAYLNPTESKAFLYRHAGELAELYVTNSETTFDVAFVETVLLDIADTSNGGDDLCLSTDPISYQWPARAIGITTARNNCENTTILVFNSDEATMQAWELIKGMTREGELNNKFLVLYVEGHWDLYEGITPSWGSRD